jgi:alpha-tubulin suppressor-like RCC1 family protein
VCASDGSLWAFGRALHGRLGLGGGGQSVHRPTQLKLPAGFSCRAVAAGGFSSAALTRDGQVLTWGASQNGELGRNTFDNSNVPSPVHGLEGTRIVQMSLGGFHGLALDEQGRVWGWGFNGSMQLGVKGKKIVPQAELLPLPSHAPAVHVAAGGAHSLVVLQDGRCV